MKSLHRLAPIVWALSLVHAAGPSPETSAAFDHYVKLTEQEIDRRTGSDFVSLEKNPKQKTLVWLGQTVIEPKKTLDEGHEIDIPDGQVQDWIGDIYIEGEPIDRVRDMLLNFADYKNYFKQQIIESKLVKRDGDHFDAFLRLNKRQVTPIVLNTQLSALYTLVDPTRAYIVYRSTHLAEVAHPNKKNTYDQERSAEDAAGYLWRLNFYYRLHQTDDGVYVELELITLSRPGGGLHPGRFLSGFEGFPRELVEAFLGGLRDAFPLRR
ncbi:MAG TPA: hypothetical protein VNX70_12810 [Bryobacteraceae bacterium]|nr:hypothetical protein [Bryobacteraceae bacterium]